MEATAPTSTSPAFWRTAAPRTPSSASLTQRPTLIALEDHSEASPDNDPCWAAHVSVADYTVVSGPSGIGAYVVWNVTVATLKGGPFVIRKRYSEFAALRAALVAAFPHAEASVPALPRKSVVSRFREKFLENRRVGLEHFLNCILLNPEFSGSPVLRDFVFGT